MRSRLGRVVGSVILLLGTAAAAEQERKTQGWHEVSLPVGVAPVRALNGDPVFGIVARSALDEPRLGRLLLVGRLPTGASLRLRADGTALFSYADLFGGRLRNSWLTPADDPDEIDLLDPANAAAAPKLLEEIRRDGLRALVHYRAIDTVLWSGDLVWRFDFRRPVRSLRLAAADGSASTRVGDLGSGLEIAFSADGTRWHTVWRSPGPSDEVRVAAELPASLRGAEEIWLRLRSSEGALRELRVSAELAAEDLLSLLRGPDAVELRSAGGSTNRAILFGQTRPLRADAGAALRFPKSTPAVVERADRIRVLFPNRAGIELARDANGGVTGIRRIFVGERALVDALPETRDAEGIALEVVGPGEVGGVRDWKAYLRERAARDMAWPQRGARRLRILPLSGYRYLGAEVGEGEVVLRFAGGRKERLALALASLTEELDGRRHLGLAWQLRTTGVAGAIGLRVVEPAVVENGAWNFQQLWGRWIERRADFATPFFLPRAWYFADSQPFHFQAGPQGTRIATFDRAVAARVAVQEDAGRLRIEASIPLAGDGALRLTPWRIWLTDDTPVGDKWAALDRWTALYEALAAGWREDLGLGRSEVRPLLWHSHGFEPRAAGAAGPDYFSGLAGEALEIAETYAFPRFLVDGPWESDWGHEESDYLPGSASFGSANAPWRLEPEPALGGREGLRRLAEAARKRGIELLLWTTPGHLSNSSPLFVEHPDWLRWRVDGRPEDADYADITGTAMESGWFAYATRAAARLARTVPIAGFLVDSWLTFGVYADARAPAPEPSLSRSIALQKAWRRAGLPTILLEGVGPFGVSGGGFGGELLANPEEAPAAQRAFAAIRGREYGLYRYVADTEVEPRSYYRALAAGGAVSVGILDLLERLDARTREAVGRANRDHARVRDLLQRRHLIGRGEDWLGASWSRDDSDAVAVFAFAPFELPTEGRDRVLDVTTGTPLQVSGRLVTESFHTYRLEHP